MEDDSIDMVISHFDMGYLVTLPPRGLGRRHGASMSQPPENPAARHVLVTG